MPTPMEILLDPTSLMVLALYGGLMLWEAAAPARALPKVKGWWARGFTSFVAYFYLSSYLPLLWDEPLARYQLFDASGLGSLGGATVGVLVYELGVYIWHRAMHSSNALFQGVHQMHHSAERVDAIGAFYFSPLGMAAWTLVGSLALCVGVGLSAQAVTAFLLITTFLGVFQHANIKTPRWLGYIVQRPESHTVHHERGVHAFNYSDLPVFDIVFGTFRNPEEFPTEVGFYPGASARVADMLRMRDVTSPPTPAVAGALVATRASNTRAAERASRSESAVA